MAEAPARRTGLGRGLQALLPTAGEQPHAPDPTDWLGPGADAPASALAQLVESGLDVLQRAVGAEICAYVHGRGQGRPHLWLRSAPDAEVTAVEWVELGMAAVGAVLGQVRVPRTVRLGETELLAVPTRGGESSGVHLLGCAGRGLTDHERTVAIHLVQALGEALHGLLPERGEPDPNGRGEPAGPPADGSAARAVTAATAHEVEEALRAEEPEAPAPVPVTERPPVRPSVIARWPATVDVEELVRDAVAASGVRPSHLDVRLRPEKGTDVIDVAAAHRGDLVRVVLPADPGDPARTAAQAAGQTVNLLQLIGAEARPEEQLAG
ncbi:MAG TPA: hypothetical protein VFH50_06580 [Acidimicrobiales bacterium]|nr:hypothetical protein [Acidimicrobiales bacterium]